MRLEARITAYDVMEHIHVAVQITGHEGWEGSSPAVVFATSVQVTGVGEDDVHTWLRDVLVAVLEAT